METTSETSWNRKKYTKNIYGVIAILAGAFLEIEHILRWGQVDFLDFFGHEYLGFLLILVGILINVNWKKKGTSI